jgi:hypothetical protein
MLHSSSPPFIPQLSDPFDMQYIDKCKSSEELEKDRTRRIALYGITHSITPEQLVDEFALF